MAYLRLDHVITKRRSSGHVNARGVALVDGDREYTYTELLERAELTAKRLTAGGVEPGDRVLVLMTNRAEWIDTFFALAICRAVLVPVSPLWVSEEIRHVVADSGARFVVSEEALAARMDPIASSAPAQRFLAVGERAGWTPLESLIWDGENLPGEAAVADEPFLLQYTSGTTGRPKAAIHTQQTILLNALAAVMDFSIGRDDACLILASLSWVAGLHALALPTLLAGGRVVLYPNEAVEVGALAAAIDRYQVTVTAIVPLIMRRMLDSEQVKAEQLAPLRMILTGSSPVPVDVLNEMAAMLPGCDVVQAYGMTEFPSSGIILSPEDAVGHVGSVGKAGLLTQVRIVDPTGRECEPGEVGEIRTRAASTALGYWNAPESSDESFVDGWFRTGDLGRIDDEGFVHVVGRTKDMIISGGLNIYAAEVERVLAEHPAVAESAVVGRPDEVWGEVPVAFVVPVREVTSDELAAYCAARLAKYKVPKHWVVRADPLPRTVTGKLQKFQLDERNQP